MEACSSCWVDSCWSRFWKTPPFFLMPIMYREWEFQILVSTLRFFNIIYQKENGVSLKTKCAVCQTNQWNIVFISWNSHVNCIAYKSTGSYVYMWNRETSTIICFAVLQVWNRKLTLNSQITFFSESVSENQWEHISKNNTTFLLLLIFHIYVIQILL